MKRLLLRLIVAILTFVFSYTVTWVTAYFGDEPAPNQTRALRHVREIGTAQAQYAATKGKGKFTDLETLGREGLIDGQLASGDKDGYIFISKPFTESKDSPGMFDIMAKPKSAAPEIHSFYSNETLVIFEQPGLEPPTATPFDRIPKNGDPLQ
jgi:hypothetical protein